MASCCSWSLLLQFCNCHHRYCNFANCYSIFLTGSRWQQQRMWERVFWWGRKNNPWSSLKGSYHTKFSIAQISVRVASSSHRGSPRDPREQTFRPKLFFGPSDWNELHHTPLLFKIWGLGYRKCLVWRSLSLDRGSWYEYCAHCTTQYT